MTQAAKRKKDKHVPPNDVMKLALSIVRQEQLKQKYGEPIKAPKYAGVWPPDYDRVWDWKKLQAARLVEEPELVKKAKAYYKENCIAFINHWIVLHEPRNAGTGKPTRLPFIMFPRQTELVQFILDCLRSEAPGLVEKSRDMGATWICCAVSVWLWLFYPGAVIGWGSRIIDDVDKIGDPNTIFAKIRSIIDDLPEFFLPVGFNRDDHMPYKRIINPENAAAIIGQGGPHIGRGSRTLIYFLDEAAHLEYPEKADAALGDTTRVPIDLSSVSGLGTLFHRKRESGKDWDKSGDAINDKVNIFTMDWSDHPEKDQNWYNRRRQMAMDSGRLHNFAREVERDYAASVEGVLIQPEWVEAAMLAADELELPDPEDYPVLAGLDVADSKKGDLNALSIARGPYLLDIQEWGERDVGVTCRRAITSCKPYGDVRIQYDSKGIGAGVKAEYNRLKGDDLIGDRIHMIMWDSGKPVQDPNGRVNPGDPDSSKNREFFGNLKAQAWWSLARRFQNTWRVLNDPDFTCEPEELIILPKNHPLIHKLRKEVSQPKTKEDSRLRLYIDKMPEGMRSPNLADSLVMGFFRLNTRRFKARPALSAPKILQG